MAIQIPIGYKLLTETDEFKGNECQHIYSFKRPDSTEPGRSWSWKMGCIDAMWEDVRARATAAAVPGLSTSERNLKNNASFALGYLQGKTFCDAEVRIRMARAGYVFGHGITAIETVEKLLVMLNGAR
jgi:hypothetical protein